MAYGDPDWVTPGASTAEATQNAATGGSIKAPVGGNARCVRKKLSLPYDQ